MPTIVSSLLETVKRNWRGLYVLVALVVDMAAIVMSNATAYELYRFTRFDEVLPPSFADSTLLFVLVFLFYGSLLGLYRAAYHTKVGEQDFIGSKAYLFCLGTILGFLFVTHQIDYPRLYLVFFFASLPAFLFVFRAAVNRVNRKMQGRGFGIYHALIMNYDDRQADELLLRFENLPELGYRVHPYKVQLRNGNGSSPSGILDLLSATIDDERIDCIFIPSIEIINDGYSGLVPLCQKKKIKLKVLSEEWEDLLRFVHVRDIGGVSLHIPPKLKTLLVKRTLKRVFDIIGALAGLLLLSPLFLVVSIAIYLEDGRPIFFKQQRALVPRGRHFGFLKFRSMVKGAEERQMEFYDRNKRTGGLFLVHNDPRVTRVGKFIRKFSIDELPQLWNVLTGDMSLVGPRPLSFRDLANIAPNNMLEGYYTLREQAKAGMTGLWQISGRREIGFREMVLLDLYYVEHQTILFDLEILFHTIPVVVFGKGAY